MIEEGKKEEDWGPHLELEGRVLIYPHKPLPELNGMGGAAYVARFKNDVSQDLFAIICSRDYLPRLEDVGAMRLLDSPGIIRLRESGVVYWPDQDARYYALVYEKPLAPRYWSTLEDKHPTMTEDSLLHFFIKPLVKTLLDLQHMGTVHGGVRPTNIFWRDGSSSSPQMGESLSAPCGVGQPAIFETIERAMCEPEARGAGQHADDCYAFGATLAMVLFGGNPFKGMDDASILRAKMEKGSFNAFVGARRLASSHIELLRGLLAEDAQQRWTAEDVDQWTAGRRQTVRNADAGRKSSRQFKLAGKDYSRLKPLAAAMAENVPEAVKIIEDGSLAKWLVRSLGDDEKSKDVAEVIERLKNAGKAAHYQEQLVARVCIALDPAAPIRYRGVSVMPAAVAGYLAHTIKTGGNIQIIADIISSQLVTQWVNMQREAKVDLVPLAQQMERQRTNLEKTSYGDGIERVLYELNPAIPCLSPMLKKECVIGPRYVMAALERVAATGAHPSEPMDRHLAGFLVARERRPTALFAAMDPSETPMSRGLAMLTLYGELQYRHGPDEAPHLAGWIMLLVEPCIMRFLSRPFQEKVRTQARDAVKKGNLALLLKYVDDPGRVTKDEQDFLEARLMYLKVQREIAGLEKDMSDKGNIIRDVGRPIAASIATLIALVMIGLTLTRAMLQALG